MRLTRFACGFVLVAGLAGLTGCGPNFGPKAKNGIVFYCPGASNWDMGEVSVRDGLEKAGFEGQVAAFYWSIAPIPIAGAAVDQYARFNPRLRAGLLARSIEEYIDRFPGRPVHLIGLSAGTGVALWALEDLKPGYRVDNVVLLSSSLSSNFDARKSFEHVTGRVYVYYSSSDPVLAIAMRATGTIDGSFTEEPVGLVGFRGPGNGAKVVNVAYSPDFAKYGYRGQHLDSTASRFVTAVIAPQILRTAEMTTLAMPRTGVPNQLASTPPDGSGS
jgi:pimeloyl-ACP methyl ester carboxylesterase